jgi:hypothetical protein
VNVDVGRDRRRKANIHRSEIVRERIEDHLMRSGGKNSRDRYIAIREDFVRSALRTAQRLGIRSWKGDDANRIQHNAHSSLSILFGEKAVTSSRAGGAVVRTGVNAGWVLDIWEATLDHITREGSEERKAERQAEIAAGPRDDGSPINDPGGIKVFNIAATAPVSVRLLEAYLGRDDETIMRIAVELEHIETNGVS